MQPVHFHDGHLPATAYDMDPYCFYFWHEVSLELIGKKGALPLIYGTAELDYEYVSNKRVAIFERRLSQEDAEAYARRIANK